MSYICIVSDGKPGHLNQSLGLAEALQKRRPELQVRLQTPLNLKQQLAALLPGEKSDVVLVLGAGHATHRSLLLLARKWQVPAVVLMKPTLPLAWFDLCLIPEHDQPALKGNIVATRGALNRMHPAEKQANTGIFLIGGPSKHVRWDEAKLLTQLNAILERDPARQWQLTTSRRTPDSTLAELQQLQGVQVFPAAETESGWLPTVLSATEVCWVTEDSVSMVYESLSAGCQVGTLPVEGGRDGRLGRGLSTLQEQGLILPWDDYIQGSPLSSTIVLDEAGRCAELILAKGWF